MKVQHHILALLIFAATLYTFLAPPAVGFAESDLARVIFFHVSCAFVSSGLMIMAIYFGIQWFRKQTLEWDARLGTVLELGALFSLFTILTGILFSKVQWGHFWHADPRQTSFLMVVLLYGGAIALRTSFSDEWKRASASAGYAIALGVLGVFLSFFYPRIPAVQQSSVHPSDTLSGGKLDTPYQIGFLGIFILLSFLSVFIYRMRVRVVLMEQQLDNFNEHDPARGGDPASVGVVRPVAVSEEHGGTPG